MFRVAFLVLISVWLLAGAGVNADDTTTTTAAATAPPTTATPWYILDPKPILDFLTSQAANPVLLGLIFMLMCFWSLVLIVYFLRNRTKACRAPATNREQYRADGKVSVNLD